MRGSYILFSVQFRMLIVSSKGDTRYRKFSTSINSLPACSKCVQRIHRPSGERDRPAPKLRAMRLSKLASSLMLFVAKLKN
jgi:hypothetical protein